VEPSGTAEIERDPRQRRARCLRPVTRSFFFVRHREPPENWHPIGTQISGTKRDRSIQPRRRWRKPGNVGIERYGGTRLCRPLRNHSRGPNAPVRYRRSRT
jgi:hypothetical protein